MPVYATDGLLGSIVSVPRVDLGDPSAPAEVVVLDVQAGPGVEEFRRITRDAIDRVENRALYLNLSRAEAPHASAVVASAHRQLPTPGERLSVPLVEEAVEIDRRVVELGYVHVHKAVEEHIDEQEVSLRHQQVEVERVPVDRVITDLIDPYMDGDVYVVPVIEEEVVVTRRLRLKEELRIRRSAGERLQTVRTPFRRETVTIDERWYDSDDGQPGPPSDGQQEPATARELPAVER
jgi:uncharacterized protein (TIGR02271 family)